MAFDALGRPTTKVCPDCRRDDLGRTARHCPCGHEFIGHDAARRARAAYEAASTRDTDSFDCIALDDGGMRLCGLPGGDVILSPQQRQVVAIELGAPTA